MKYLLDTNVFVHAARHKGNVRTRVAACTPDLLCTTVVTLAEVLYGALKMENPEQARREWLSILAPFAQLEFCAVSAQYHARLRFDLRQSPIGERDLLIASIALANDMTVVTHNTREFARVPTLSWEDWF